MLGSSNKNENYQVGGVWIFIISGVENQGFLPNETPHNDFIQELGMRHD